MTHIIFKCQWPKGTASQTWVSACPVASGQRTAGDIDKESWNLKSILGRNWSRLGSIPESG